MMNDANGDRIIISMVAGLPQYQVASSVPPTPEMCQPYTALVLHYLDQQPGPPQPITQYQQAVAVQPGAVEAVQPEQAVVSPVSGGVAVAVLAGTGATPTPQPAQA